MRTDKISVIGAGLAGSEAAWQIASRGINVDLYEMRPHKSTPAHHTGYFAELVCSNSFRAANIENAVGLLKEELRRCNSLIMKCADENEVPAGGALAVDREKFAQSVTEKLKSMDNINVIYDEVIDINFDHPVIIASGPLTSPNLAEYIKKLTGEDHLYFYDAAAPIVTKDSINMEKAFFASRYDKGDPSYINCPMTKDEYLNFYHKLTTAEQFTPKNFEKQIFFEGCMPIEEMANRGEDTLRFGPMKPVGLPDPKTGEIPYAVVQLRQDNIEGTLYNLVGFQTKLKWGQQKEVFKLIPGLEEAEFVRMGAIHRNTFLNAPKLLEPTMGLKGKQDIYFAGQITGVEGYVESVASGLVAGLNCSNLVKGERNIVFPEATAIGALCKYITTVPNKNFQPMNVNFGILPKLSKKIRDKKLKNKMIAERALTELDQFQNCMKI